MSDNPEIDDATRQGLEFERQQLLNHAECALMVLGPQYLGDEALHLRERLRFDIRHGESTGEVIPLTRQDNQTDTLTMLIEPEAIWSYAEDLIDDINHEVEIGDVAKLLVGAGVARCILGWKISRMTHGGEETRNDYLEQLCSKSYLWEMTALADEESMNNVRGEIEDNDQVVGVEVDDSRITALRQTVERLGDDQILRINVLRFAIGASLTHLCDSKPLHDSLLAHVREALLDLEQSRHLNLRFNLAWLDSDSAFRDYDDTVPELEIACSFPMSPGEELQSFAAVA